MPSSDAPLAAWVYGGSELASLGRSLSDLATDALLADSAGKRSLLETKALLKADQIIAEARVAETWAKRLRAQREFDASAPLAEAIVRAVESPDPRVRFGGFA